MYCVEPGLSTMTRVAVENGCPLGRSQTSVTSAPASTPIVHLSVASEPSLGLSVIESPSGRAIAESVTETVALQLDGKCGGTSQRARAEIVEPMSAAGSRTVFGTCPAPHAA